MNKKNNIPGRFTNPLDDFCHEDFELETLDLEEAKDLIGFKIDPDE
jgi:hypothetical protein